MSTDFHIRTGRRVRRAAIDPGLTDLRWHGDEPPDPLGKGEWAAFRIGISTRVTTVVYERRRVTVTVRSGASVEDCNLALSIVRRVAGEMGSKVDCEGAGMLTLEQLDQRFDDEWKRQQLESAARVSIALARERGMIAMPGPTRDVLIGPRVIAELERSDPETSADKLVEVMRRALWPDRRYESAGKFEASGPDGESFTLTMLLPNRPCVLPHTDRLAVEGRPATDHVFVIPRRALAELPVEITWLDDGNQLVEGISDEDWSAVCEAARLHEIDDGPA